MGGLAPGRARGARRRMPALPRRRHAVFAVALRRGRPGRSVRRLPPRRQRRARRARTSPAARRDGDRVRVRASRGETLRKCCVPPGRGPPVRALPRGRFPGRGVLRSRGARDPVRRAAVPGAARRACRSWRSSTSRAAAGRCAAASSIGSGREDGTLDRGDRAPGATARASSAGSTAHGQSAAGGRLHRRRSTSDGPFYRRFPDVGAEPVRRPAHPPGTRRLRRRTGRRDVDVPRRRRRRSCARVDRGVAFRDGDERAPAAPRWSSARRLAGAGARRSPRRGACARRWWRRRAARRRPAIAARVRTTCAPSTSSPLAAGTRGAVGRGAVAVDGRDRRVDPRRAGVRRGRRRGASARSRRCCPGTRPAAVGAGRGVAAAGARAAHDAPDARVAALPARRSGGRARRRRRRRRRIGRTRPNRSVRTRRSCFAASTTGRAQRDLRARSRAAGVSLELGARPRRHPSRRSASTPPGSSARGRAIRALIGADDDASAWLPPDLSLAAAGRPGRACGTRRSSASPIPEAPPPQTTRDRRAGRRPSRSTSELATDGAGVPALLATAHADWAALIWLCWAVGLDRVALPDAVRAPRRARRRR